MMRVLLVYTNRYRTWAPPPVGLAYLMGPLRKEGHEVKLLDLMFSDDPAGKLDATIDSFKPDLVGFSIRNIDNQDRRNPMFFLGQARELVDVAIKKGVTTVIGGTAFTTFPTEMLTYMGADYGISGQGEKGLLRLAKSLTAGKLDTAIPGLVWRENGSIRVNRPDLSGYRALRADWEALSLKKYEKGLFSGSVVTKTGCPHRCSYCNVTATFGDRFAFRDTGDIVQEIKTLKQKHGINIFSLTDACFNTPLDYAKNVLKAIADARLKIYLNTNLIPILGQYDDELLTLYKKAGGILLSLGTETLSEKMLKNYNKPFTLEDVRACAKLCDKHRVPFMIQALFGGPGENEATIKESMAMLPEIHYSRFVYGIGIRILPGTELFETAKKEGVVREERELFVPRFYVSRDLDVMWADQYIKGRLRHFAYRNIKMVPVMAKCALARRLGVVI